MADVNANINVNINTSNALAQLKALQKQIGSFHTSIATSSQQAAMAQKALQANLIHGINSTGQFAAGMRTINTTAESFTRSLEKNRLSMREYFRYSAASTQTFGRFFKSELETVNKVARERVKTLQTQYIKMGRDANGAMKAIAVRPLALDMNNLSTQTALAAQKQAVLNQLLKQGSTNLLNFGKNTQWAGRQLMVGFTVPLMYIGGFAAKAFMDIEKEVIRFKRVYGEMFTTPAETDKMAKELQSVADQFTKYGVAVKDTMKMAADAAATGKMGADLIAQVTEATRLAVLGYVDQEAALKTTISLTNAFGVAATDLAKKTDFLNAVENQTVLSIEDFTIAIPKAGPVVKQLGGSVEDLAFFMTAMKEGGINASEGANALKSGLASLINPTDKASKMLAGMGINIKGIVESNKGNLKQTVLDFAYALDGLKPLERSRAIEQLFGKFQFARLSTLFQNVISQGTQSERVLQLTKATTEELAILSERELKTTEQSSMYKFKKSVEDLKKTLAPVGEQFLKAITPVVDFFKNIFEKFNNLSDGTKSIITTIVGVVAGLGPILLMTFGLFANGIANIIKLGLTLRNGYLRLTGQSKGLAAQTRYLTTEQLDAAAVAASLQQSHSRLTQQFNIEATAVKNLRDQYEQALIAARNFAAANPGMMRPGFVGPTPRRYADGVVSVPGPKGAGDVVPAMLTPGESVISAPLTKKYGGLINAISSDSVPGYNDGTTPTTPPPRPPRRTPFFSQAAGTVYDRSHAEGLGPGAGGLLSQFSSALSSANPVIKNFANEVLGSTNVVTISKDAQNNLNSELLETTAIEQKRNAIAAGIGGVTPGFSGTAIASPANRNNIAFGSPAFQRAGLGAGEAITLDRFNQQVQLAEREFQRLTGQTVEASGALQDSDVITNLVDSSQEKYAKGLLSLIKEGRDVEANYNTEEQFLRRRISQMSGALAIEKNNEVATQFETEVIEMLSRTGTLSNGQLLDLNAALEILSTAAIKYSDTLLIATNSGAVQGTKRAASRLIPSGYTGPNPMRGIPTSIVPRQTPAFTSRALAARIVTDIPKEIEQAATNAGTSFRRTFVRSTGNMVGDALDVGRASPHPKAPKNGGQDGQAYRSAFLTEVQKAQKVTQSLASRYPGVVGTPTAEQKSIRRQQEKLAGRPVAAPTVSPSQSARDTWRLQQGADRQQLRQIDQIAAKRQEMERAAKTMAVPRGTSVDVARNLRTAELQQVRKMSDDKVLAIVKKEEQERIAQSKAASQARKQARIAADQQIAADQKAAKAQERAAIRAADAKRLAAIEAEAAAYANSIRGRTTAFAKSFERSLLKTKMGGLFAFGPMKAIRTEQVALAQAEKTLQQEILATRQQQLIAERDELKNEMLQNGLSEQQAKKLMEINAELGIIEKQLEQKSRGGGAGGGFGGKMMGVGMAASTALMMGSMAGGKAGEISQKLMMPVMALTMLAPMLANPWGILVAAVLSLGALFWKYKSDIDNARKEGIGLAKAMSMTTDKIISLSKVTGTVSATELENRKRTNLLSGTSEAQRRSGQTILQSDFGKQLVSDITTQQKAGFDAEKISKNIANNLTQAVLQGAITTAQARSIASALGEKLGSYEIPAMISGNLVQLLGPNGEDLLSNPLEIILKVKEDTKINVQTAFENAAKEINPEEAFKKNAGWTETILNSMIPLPVQKILTTTSKVPGLGWLRNVSEPGTKMAVDKEQARRDAVAVQVGAESLAQNQRNVDELNRAYDIKVKTAKTDKEIKTLEDKRAKDLAILTTENQKVLDDLKKRAQEMGPGFNDAVNAAINAAYKDAPDSIKVPVEIAQENLKNLESPIKTTLQLGLASKDLTGETVTRLVEWSKENPKIDASIDLFVSKNGIKNLDTVRELISKTGADANTAKVMLDYVNNNTQELDKDVEALSVLSNFNAKYAVKLDVKTSGKKELEAASRALNAIAPLPENLDFKLVTKLAGENPEIFGSIKDNWAALSQGESTINKNLVANVSVGLIDPNVLSAAELDTGKKGIPAVMEYLAKGYTPPTPRTTKDNNKDTGKKTGPAASALDEITNKLRLFQDAGVKSAVGFKAAWSQITQYLERNKKKFDLPFQGLSQQLSGLRSKNIIGKPMLDLMLGMDPKEFEKNKKKFFRIDKGIITGLTEDGKKLERALKAIAIGEWQASLKNQKTDLKDQETAFNKLTKAGISVERAYELVSDQALASEIAHTKNNKQLNQAIKLYGGLSVANKAADAIKNARLEIEKTNNALALKNKIQSFKAGTGYDSIIQFAIESDQTLKDLFENGQQYSEVFAKRLQQVLTDVNFDPNAMFETGYSKAMEYFSAKENAIQLKFEMDSAPFQAIIKNAESQISAIQYKINGWQADLTRIQVEEDKINEKYDLQTKALDQIAKINEDIIAQQKGQLSIADALSQGDISAAAKAIQDMRAQQAQRNAAQKKDILDAARTAELASITNAQGLTRTQIEAKIKDLETEIFNIQQNSLEPARESVRLLEEKKQKEIDSLSFVGLTKLQWELQKSAIDLAKTSTDAYADAAKKALDIVKDILKYWQNIANLQKNPPGVTPYYSNLTPADIAADATAVESVTTQVDTKVAALTPDVLASQFNNSIGQAQLYLANQMGTSAGLSPHQMGMLTGLYISSGGLVPKYFANGGLMKPKGTDTVPAMLTPGEFVIKKSAVDRMGITNLEKINNHDFDGASVYNYSLSVNLNGSDMSADDVANVVMTKIKTLEGQRIRRQVV